MPVTSGRNQLPLKREAGWYKDAIIYQVNVRAFTDTNGDGIGDFPGLAQRLDYVQELGVNAIWLMPFFPSPLRDDGYDISDYKSVHPNYGTLDDFKKFLSIAHDRGIHVIIEIRCTEALALSFWIQSYRTGHGIPSRNNTIGIGSSVISLTSITTILRCAKKCGM